MTRNMTLAARLREVFLDGKWIANTNYIQQLQSTSYEEAICKVGNLNTLAALTFHINYYLKGLLNVFDGGKLEISDKYSWDLPPLNEAEDWNHMVADFIKNAELFVKAVEQMEDSRLDLPFVDEKYGNYLRNIEGVIEHSYYHLGQISLIRKMIQQSGPGKV